MKVEIDRITERPALNKTSQQAQGSWILRYTDNTGHVT